MCDATFAFGQRGGHFMQYPSRREHHRLPPKLVRLLTSAQVSKIYHVTLGYQDSFLVTFQDRGGRDLIDAQDLPAELDAFLYARGPQNQLLRHIPSIRVTLGPYNTSFYAADLESCRWMNLPPRLLTALQSRIEGGAWIDKPRIVALGADSNFLLITEKHAAVRDLRNYKSLRQMLEFSKPEDRGIEGLRDVVLHAYRYEAFLALNRTGIVIFDGLPSVAMSAVERMKEAVKIDVGNAQMRRIDFDRRQTASPRKIEAPRRPSLQHQATLKREWAERKDQVRKQTGGLRLSLSLSISARGVGRSLGLG
ncbi:hypothetical protein P154DRAFT_521038 [Amniculicola lignicola CBS 123094]|uniref:Uncharacterized protein n=1 Tax=Amniculicola lignicola CBS 123094 TaxID=1392246 RepID=A0A6A5WN68_9PLEO|nr:hypothetical protein P154DRAFT_521038 [Amniculicola lignicola CBS 123094]